MSILSLDLARKTGWAFATDEAVEAWPVDQILNPHGPTDGVRYGLHRFDGDRGGPLWTACGEWFVGLLAELDPAWVIYERPVSFAGRAPATDISYGFKTVVEIHCDWASRHCFHIEPTAAKKHFTGAGNASKDDMVRAAEARGWRPGDHNVADALAILDYGVHTLHVARRNGGT